MTTISLILFGNRIGAVSSDDPDVMTAIPLHELLVNALETMEPKEKQTLVAELALCQSILDDSVPVSSEANTTDNMPPYYFTE